MRRRTRHRKPTNPCAPCSRQSCSEFNTVWACARWRSVPAFRCSKRAKFWRGCAPSSTASKAYAQRAVDRAGLTLEIGTPLGWRMRCPSGMNPRTIRNFPIQSTGAEILHVACVLAERRGIEVVAPVHDALVVEADADRAEEISAGLDRVMRDAAAVVLRGYELRTDVQVIPAGANYHDKRGIEMWTTVTKLLGTLEDNEREKA